mgnify:CR=1 FL=1
MKRSTFIFNLIRETIALNQEQLKFLNARNNHWEKWFQVELGTSLERLEAQDISLENNTCRFDTRKKNTAFRIENAFKTAQIDLVFRRKRETKGKYIGIELKQTDSIQGLKSVFADMVKINALRGSDWPFRELYFVLFYYDDGREHTKYDNLYNDLLQSEKISSEVLTFDSAPDLKCLVLYWDSGVLTEKMSITSFKKWFVEIDILMKKYGLTNIAKGKSRTKDA